MTMTGSIYRAGRPGPAVTVLAGDHQPEPDCGPARGPERSLGFSL